jgi:hypothetical protein
MTTRIGLGKGQGSGYKNIIPHYDRHIHQLSGKGIKQPQKMSTLKKKASLKLVKSLRRGMKKCEDCKVYFRKDVLKCPKCKNVEFQNKFQLKNHPKYQILDRGKVIYASNSELAAFRWLQNYPEFKKDPLHQLGRFKIKGGKKPSYSVNEYPNQIIDDMKGYWRPEKDALRLVDYGLFPLEKSWKVQNLDKEANLFVKRAYMPTNKEAKKMNVERAKSLISNVVDKLNERTFKKGGKDESLFGLLNTKWQNNLRTLNKLSPKKKKLFYDKLSKRVGYNYRGSEVFQYRELDQILKETIKENIDILNDPEFKRGGKCSPSELKHGSDPDTIFNRSQLKAGIKVETEHTNDRSLAKAIAKAHLSEDKAYYTKLKEAKL